MSKIKICGLFRSQDIDAVNDVLPDYIGFVFASSKRQVDHTQARMLKEKLDTRIKAVGVFTDAAQDTVAALCDDGTLDAVQLHGSEDGAYIKKLRQRTDVPIIKAVRMHDKQQILNAQQFDCEYLLLDTLWPGSGRVFDWALIPRLEKPYFLAGGIHTGNIKQAAALGPYCIDLSSGAETNGIKDKRKIEALVRMARSVT